MVRELWLVGMISSSRSEGDPEMVKGSLSTLLSASL